MDQLLLKAVVPLIDDLEVARLTNRFFYLRYWDGGSHLRLRVLPSQEAKRADVELDIRDKLEQYFALYPSRDKMSQEQYASIASRLASLERLPAYTERVRPNNSVAFIGYRREHDRYGDGDSIEAVERHFTESSRIALDLLSAGISGDARATAAIAMILLAWFSTGPLPALRAAKWVDGRGSAWKGYADSQCGRLAELGRCMRAISLTPVAALGEGTLARWARSMAILRDALLQAGSDVFPVLDTCAHLVCNRLGVALDEEMVLRYAAARSVGFSEPGSGGDL